MFHSLSLYAFINAKVKALFSFLLTETQLEALIKATTLEEFGRLLQATPYREIASAPTAFSDPRRMEQELVLHDIGIYQKIISSAKGELREMVFSLLEKYDLNNLKSLLRLWFQPQERFEEVKYLIAKTICYPLPIKEILAARSLSDVIAHLEATPYQRPLLAMRADFDQRKTLFPVEVALDSNYYRRLHEQLASLGPADRRIAGRLIGIEVDIENIKLLIRLKELYKIPLGELLHYLLPHGRKLNQELIKNLARSGDLSALLSSLASQTYHELMPLFSREFDLPAFALLEGALWEMLMQEARSAFRASPFTIATVMAYLIYKSAETRRIISIMYGKMYSLPPEELKRILR